MGRFGVRTVLVYAGFAAVATAAVVAAYPAMAADAITVAASHKGSWDTSLMIWGQQQGYFKNEGLKVNTVWTNGGSDSQEAVISGAVDIAIQTGVLGVLSAYEKGAPIRVLGAAMTGSGGLYWYVNADSSIKDLKDAAGKTMAYSRPGSSTNLVAEALVKQAGVPIKLVPAGGQTATLTQVMSGQIDIGWAGAPVELDKVDAGTIRIVARGDNLPEVRGQTIRVHVANAHWLKDHRDVARRFMKALWEATEYLYSPEGMADYVKLSGLKKSIVKRTTDEFVPLNTLRFTPIGEMDLSMKQAVRFKRLEKPLTDSQLKELVQVVYKPKADQ